MFLCVSNIFWPKDIFFPKSFRFMFIRRNYDAFRQKKYFFQNLSESGLLGTNMMLLSVSNSFRQKNIFYQNLSDSGLLGAFERFKQFVPIIQFFWIQLNNDEMWCFCAFQTFFDRKIFLFKNLSDSCLLGANMMLLSVSINFRRKNILFKNLSNSGL